jgi:LuxR family transcriptional regulator
MDVLATLDRIVRSDSIEGTWQLLLDAMAGYGFDRLLYGYTRFKTANSYGDSDDMLILSNHDRDYISKFVDGRMYLHAPMVRWATENTGSRSWRWWHDNFTDLNAEERKVAEFNISRGLHAGYTISFKGTSIRSRGAIALTGRGDLDQTAVDEIWAASERDIELINNVAHLRITNLPHPGRRQLTQRQREALEWVGDGKTTQDIATIMGLTPATVEKHLRLAREALDVETTAQAVLKASFQNQIFVVSA